MTTTLSTGLTFTTPTCPPCNNAIARKSAPVYQQQAGALYVERATSGKHSCPWVDQGLSARPATSRLCRQRANKIKGSSSGPSALLNPPPARPLVLCCRCIQRCPSLAPDTPAHRRTTAAQSARSATRRRSGPLHAHGKLQSRSHQQRNEVHLTRNQCRVFFHLAPTDLQGRYHVRHRSDKTE